MRADRRTDGSRLPTHFELLPKHGPLPQGRAVPAAVPELELALVDARLDSLSHHDDGVGSALTDRPLPGGQARDLVADDAGSQSDNRRQPPATRRKRDMQVNMRPAAAAEQQPQVCKKKKRQQLTFCVHQLLSLSAELMGKLTCRLVLTS